LKLWKFIFKPKKKAIKNSWNIFLKLSKVERIYSFLGLILKMKQFPTKRKIENKSNNFVIELKEKIK
jgi:hypothetical protein